MTITRTIEFNDISPAELAETFCYMNSAQQAEFFSRISAIAATWPGAGWCQQSCAIAGDIDYKGREVIEKLAEHVLNYNQTLAALRRIAIAANAGQIDGLTEEAVNAIAGADEALVLAEGRPA